MISKPHLEETWNSIQLNTVNTTLHKFRPEILKPHSLVSIWRAINNLAKRTIRTCPQRNWRGRHLVHSTNYIRSSTQVLPLRQICLILHQTLVIKVVSLTILQLMQIMLQIKLLHLKNIRETRSRRASIIPNRKKGMKKLTAVKLGQINFHFLVGIRPAVQLREWQKFRLLTRTQLWVLQILVSLVDHFSVRTTSDQTKTDFVLPPTNTLAPIKINERQNGMEILIPSNLWLTPSNLLSRQIRLLIRCLNSYWPLNNSNPLEIKSC